MLALALYSVTVLVLGRLALTRFDLVAGIAILMAGHSARSPGRCGRVARASPGRSSSSRSRPRPRMTRRGTSLRLLAAAAAVPIVAQVVYALWSGEPGLSWIGYHTGRDPEIESWAAVLADLARGLGAHVGHGLRPRQPEPDGHDRALAGAHLRARLARRRAAAWRAACAPRQRRRRALAARRARRARRAGTGALAAVPALDGAALGAARPALSAAGRAAGRREPCSRALELRYAFDDLPHFEWGAVALVALRNAVLIAFAVVLWRSETSTARASGRRPTPA